MLAKVFQEDPLPSISNTDILIFLSQQNAEHFILFLFIFLNCISFFT